MLPTWESLIETACRRRKMECLSVIYVRSDQTLMIRSYQCYLFRSEPRVTVRLHRTVFAPVRTVRPVRRFLKNELFAVRTVRCSHCSLFALFGGPWSQCYLGHQEYLRCCIACTGKLWCSIIRHLFTYIKYDSNVIGSDEIDSCKWYGVRWIYSFENVSITFIMVS